jgi:hypothetical protein
MLLFGFSLDDFISWLRSKVPDEMVGLAAHCNSCPLAAFIGERMEGAVDMRIGGAICYWPDWTDVTSDVPTWARMFMTDVDTAKFNTPVTAAQALHIAQGLKANG